MVAAADLPPTPDRVVLGPVVHATQRELALAHARAAGRDEVRVSPVPTWVLRALSPVSRDVRALASTSYLFTEPLVVDEAACPDLLGVRPTPLEAATRSSVDA
jgi:nitrate reductase alpha subunit